VPTTADVREVDHFRRRVRLYLLVMLAIDVLAYVSDLLSPILFDVRVAELAPHLALYRWTITGVLLAGWAFARFTNPGRRALVVLETSYTLGLVLLEVPLGFAYPWSDPSHAPAVMLLAMVLLLVVRASLVPSTTVRTGVVGLFTVAWVLIVAYRIPGAFEPTLFDALTFMGVAFVLATAVTSHVIYGLRRQVRHAMRLGQYELGRKLGEGGMGVVHEATHLMLRRPTAVKLLPVEKAGEQTVARFEREVVQTSRLEHPNSVSIYDYGRTPDGQFYYAMELVDGVTLQQLVDRDGALSEGRAAVILRQAARALAEAHARGLVHRDVKPANVMLCERAQVPDTVKVLDFGLVKAVDDPEADGLTQANAIVGTPHYLAPEAISSPDDVGPPADVYALGAIGFLLVTGREVFPGKSTIDVCSKHLHTAPDSPTAVRGEAIHPDLEALILRCLEKRPDARPRDGAALADALDRLDLPGWGREEAGAWWREFRDDRVAAGDSQPTPTQLAVDVEGRR
jgi:serine/threonine-protein kinase